MSDNPFAAMLPLGLAKLDQIAALDQKLVKFHGTMAEWQKKAVETIDGTTMAATLAKWKMNPTEWADEFLSPITSLVTSDSATVAEFAAAVDRLNDQSSQYREDECTLFIRAGMGQTDEQAIMDQRNALAGEVDAYRVVLLDQKIDGADKLVVPDAPKAGRKGGGQPKGASKYLRFYRLDGWTKDDDGNIVGGTPVYPADSQQKASSVAHYQFTAPIESMEAAMRSAGWNGQYTSAWQGLITVTSKDGTKQTTKVIGWDIVGDDTNEADQTDDTSDSDDQAESTDDN